MILDTRQIITREQPNPAKVQRYAAMLRAGQHPPPLAVLRYDAGRWLLLDGHHRLWALRQAGFLHVNAEVVSR